MSKILTFLRTFQDSPLFANLALHAWAGAFVVTLAGEHLTHWKVVASFVAFATLKEFWFDAKYEIPAQPAGSIRSGGGLQDFTGYMIGVVMAALGWLI